MYEEDASSFLDGAALLLRFGTGLAADGAIIQLTNFLAKIKKKGRTIHSCIGLV
jgi:hypothetical protein